jgi:endonuclease/exonuclease/phosphatase family metal-dependent hydrolase
MPIQYSFLDFLATSFIELELQVGVGRDDGKSAGEFNPIFFRRAAFTLLETDTFWLSREPFKPGSRFPGAGTPRLATFALFQLLPSTAAEGKHDRHGDIRNVVLLNTHLDHVSDDQRKLGAAMVLHRARYEALKRPGVSVLVTGDLNSSASGPDRGAYAVFTGASAPPAVPDEFSRRFPLDSKPAGSSSEEEKGLLLMRDMRYAAPRASVGGQWATFTGFDNRKEDEVCIDFVFGRSDGVGWEAKRVFVETALSDDGMLASDHRPVVADVLIR